MYVICAHTCVHVCVREGGRGEGGSEGISYAESSYSVEQISDGGVVSKFLDQNTKTVSSFFLTVSTDADRLKEFSLI